MRSTLFLVLLMACIHQLVAQVPNTYHVKGNIAGLPDGKLMIMHRNPLDSRSIVLDSIESRNGVFEITGCVENDEPVLLVVQKAGDGMNMPPQSVRFFVQNGDVIEVKGRFTGMEMALCSGSKHNDELGQLKAIEKDDRQALQIAYREAMAAGENASPMGINVAREQLREKQLTFIREHPGYLASGMILALEAQQGMTVEELEACYNQLSPQVKQGQYGRLILETLNMEKKSAKGADAIGFTKTDILGKKVSLSDFKGKFVLLDFWGSWCGPCRANNPHLRRLYGKYKDKGLEIVGIANEGKPSLDECMKAWKAAVKEDALPWIQVLNDEGKKEFDLSGAYGISAFPTKILLDKEGKIIAKYVGVSKEGEDPLEEMLRELLGE